MTLTEQGVKSYRFLKSKNTKNQKNQKPYKIDRKRQNKRELQIWPKNFDLRSRNELPLVVVVVI